MFIFILFRPSPRGVHTNHPVPASPPQWHHPLPYRVPPALPVHHLDERQENIRSFRHGGDTDTHQRVSADNKGGLVIYGLSMYWLPVSVSVQYFKSMLLYRPPPNWWLLILRILRRFVTQSPVESSYISLARITERKYLVQCSWPCIIVPGQVPVVIRSPHQIRAATYPAVEIRSYFNIGVGKPGITLFLEVVMMDINHTDISGISSQIKL